MDDRTIATLSAKNIELLRRITNQLLTKFLDTYLPEAGATLTIHCYTKDGFQCQFTLRAHTEKHLQAKVSPFLAWLKQRGYHPLPAHALWKKRQGGDFNGK